MMMQQTLNKLHEMRLTGMAQALESQLDQPDLRGLSFEERLGMLVDHEWTYRHDRRLARLLKQAKLRISNACLEDIDYRRPRNLDRSLMFALAHGDWVRRHQDVLVTGPTGSGKTYVACALANAACRQGLSARYYRVGRLIHDLTLARADGTYPKLLEKLSKTHVLVLDDWALAPITATESRELLEVIDDRTQRGSTIVASQIPVADWHATMSDPTAADAILDRLVHTAHKIALKGESMRKALANHDPLQNQKV